MNRLALALAALLLAACPEEGPTDLDAGRVAADAGEGDAGEAGPDAGDAGPGDAGLPPTPLRYLAINVGNATPLGCWEYKLCREQDVKHLREYIATWKPDVVLLSEVLRQEQLTGTANFGPILPPDYDGLCGESRHRDTGAPAAFDAEGASHEHECIAWKRSRVVMELGSAKSAYGRNDEVGRQKGCPYDFTGFRVRLLLDGVIPLTAVTVHPDSQRAECRTEEIGRYWAELADGERVVIGGDWNTESGAEIAPPQRFRVNYERGRHWDLAEHPDEFSAHYALGAVKKKLDDAYSSFGEPCLGCGGRYGTSSLDFGSALGGYDGHPRADQGDGFDHRQVLVDMMIRR